MPICEADPWRLQYFEHAVCPPDVNIPTEDSDATATISATSRNRNSPARQSRKVIRKDCASI